jgi:hypothetical protein
MGDALLIPVTEVCTSFALFSVPNVQGARAEWQPQKPPNLSLHYK